MLLQLTQWASTFSDLFLNMLQISTQRELSGRLMSPPDSFMNYSLSVCGYIIHLLHWITFDRFDCQTQCLACQCVGETHWWNNEAATKKNWQVQNLFWNAAQTCEHVNAEKGHEWQEPSQCSFHIHSVLNAYAGSLLGTWTNIIDL